MQPRSQRRVHGAEFKTRVLAEQGSGLDENSFASNINGGILYLMLIPYLILLFLFRKPVFNFFKGLFKAKA